MQTLDFLAVRVGCLCLSKNCVEAFSVPVFVV